MKLHTWLAAALLAAATAAQAQAPIRIGAFLSVTGPAAFLGDPEQKTLELYVERLNAAGGVLGRKLELVAYDSGGDAEKARTFAKRLIEQDRVDVIVGGSTTGETMAVVPLAEAAGTPFVSLAGAWLPASAQLAGLTALATGAWLKFALVTRAALNQGFALAHPPVRGAR